MAIQTAIQTLRTVTFILQRNKDKIPAFESWYGNWQAKLRGDPLTRWMVDARNKIEKQGDLEIHSFIRADLIASHMSEEVQRVEAPARLFDDPLAIVKGLPAGDLRDHMVKHGTLRIQRRWVENTLPDYELLDATAIAYGRIALIVHDAHRQMGLDAPTSMNVRTGHQYGEGTREGRLPCMIGHADTRSLNIALSDGTPVRFERVERRFDEINATKIVQRYGDIHQGMLGPENADEEQILTSLFSVARKVFEKDGYHQSMYFLFANGKLVHFFGIQPENQAEKYLLMKTVADEVTIHGADAVISLGEVLRAPVDPSKPFLRPEESPKREEALFATLITKHGTPITLFARIHRDGENVTLGETDIIRNHAVFVFSSIYEAWRRPIPEEWKRQMKDLTKRRKSVEI